jgi:hypothetical protein
VKFIDGIVPIERIEAVFPGGFDGFKARYASDFGGRLWHDDTFSRDGAMGPVGVEAIAEFWEWHGLTEIENDAEEHCALKWGTERGEIIVRQDLPRRASAQTSFRKFHQRVEEGGAMMDDAPPPFHPRPAQKIRRNAPKRLEFSRLPDRILSR